MNKLDPALSKACTEITKNLLTINEPTKKQVKEEIIKISKIHQYKAPYKNTLN